MGVGERPPVRGVRQRLLNRYCKHRNNSIVASSKSLPPTYPAVTIITRTFTRAPQLWCAPREVGLARSAREARFATLGMEVT